MVTNDSNLPVAPLLAVQVNGQLRELAAPATVLALLEEMALVGKRVAVELNGEIVPRGLHAATPLAEGDRLEIVVAVGGG
jgi:sulfur carrier protein